MDVRGKREGGEEGGGGVGERGGECYKERGPRRNLKRIRIKANSPNEMD